ncbi:transcriptional repressor [Pyrococcus furiosus DSM 3638]|uniref:Transcriptional repressor n=3 Tax=Pyrococcus furiosus TaxID=2261 RepID=A0A5C0XNQ2_PYRFU|nr:transcriptional repressor [Pyrococcus furiosus]AAL81318.1 transcriptional regulator (furr family) [Pyrococcus furiosus DSM 3638]AFN03984.1 FUR family transcriptional regulator [Pyrococcus furiosus COM1]QEK78846.1 transcriptional repressor [Pyrococcus furiosus DSM 3638]
MWKEKAVRVLKEKGYKLTPQRLKMLEVIEELGPSHPSLNEVFKRLKEEFPTLSFSTLYSNVMTLKELGLIETLPINDETRIEINTKPHMNLIEDAKIVDIIDPEIIKIIEEKLKKKVKFVNVLVENE